MPAQLELFSIGFAAVVDTVVLLVVLERINRPLTAIWLKWSLAGVTTWHIGSFLHVTLRDTPGSTALRLDALCMSTMAFGLLLLTSGLLHGGLRVNRTGIVAQPPVDRRYVLVYFPMLFTVAVTAAVFRSRSRDFLTATQGYHLPYLLWLTASNMAATVLFLRNRHHFAGISHSAERFVLRFSVGLVAVTALTLVYVLWGINSALEPTLRLLATISPLAPTLVFAYYIFRRRLLPMVFERTLVYGAVLLAVFYLHRLTLSPIMRKYSQEFHFDFVIIEGLLIVALILAYQPLRNRVQEGLRYLIGIDVNRVRDATRQLSVELSRRSTDMPAALSQFFVQGLTDALGVRYALLQLNSESKTHSFPYIQNEYATADLKLLLESEKSTLLRNQMAELPNGRVDRSRCDHIEQLSIMRELDLIAVFQIRYKDVNGLLSLGSHPNGDRLSEEQLNTIGLLADQFAATIHTRQLDDARQAAERRAVQQEKLSTLGLLSGSLAHELKNPLSSMRTIATLLQEDLAGSESARDAEIIVSEIDRLTQTTQRLLDFSRPANADIVGICPDDVVERLMHILNHLASQHAVRIHLNLQLKGRLVDSTDAAVSEILFNLIKNAIEAARNAPDAEVAITTAVDHRDLNGEPMGLLTVEDNGPGISVEPADQIFTPFVTGKTDGTGLGLYLVAERVRETSGTIISVPQAKGVRFEVRLPLKKNGHETPVAAMNRTSVKPV